MTQPSRSRRAGPVPAVAGLAALLLMLGLVPRFALPATPDVSWLLYAAGRLADGARLGQDVVENTPPLVFVPNVAAVRIARALGIAPATAWTAGVTLLAVLCAALTGVLLGRLPAARRVGSPTMTAVVVGSVLLALPGFHFGQREHLIVMLLLPIVALAALRQADVETPNVDAMVPGLLAGIAVGIKPHYVLVPAGLALWQTCGRRGIRALVTPEHMAALALLVAYALVVAAWVPDWLRYARQYGPLYQHFLSDPRTLLELAVGLGALMAAVLLWLSRRGRSHPLVFSLGIATLAALFAYAAQLKGWPYQGLPFATLGALWLLSILATVGPGPRATAVGLWLLLLAPSAIDGVRTLGHRSVLRSDIDPDLWTLLDSLRAGTRPGRVAVLSTNIAGGFPLVPTAGAQWTFRHPSLWPLGAFYADAILAGRPFPCRSPGEWSTAELRFRQELEEDLRLRPPDVLAVLRQDVSVSRRGLAQRFDYLACLGTSPAFAAFVAGYRPTGRAGSYDLYRPGAPEARP